MKSLLSWVAEQTIFPKVYWREKGKEFAGAGEKAKSAQIPVGGSGERYFGGLAFGPMRADDTVWNAFPRSYFFVPEKSFEQEFAQTRSSWQKPRLIERRDLPDFDAWQESVERALNAIEEKQLQKVVLARRTTLTFDQAVDPFALLGLIGKNTARETLFAFQFFPQTAFIGATPEKLFCRKGSLIQSEAIAGTQPLGQANFNSAKLQLEFSYVKTWIEERLSSLCHHLKSDGGQIITTKNLEHLYHRFSGILKLHCNDRDLLHALHPTPATGGFPKEESLSHLFLYEFFDRGWYAAPLGYTSNEESSFVVGIRSALVSGCEVHLFAGAGIVPGSDPREEWEELEMKIAQYTEVLL